MQRAAVFSIRRPLPISHCSCVPSRRPPQVSQCQTIATPVQDVAEIENVLAELARQPNAGLICPSDSYTSTHRKTIIALAERHAIPAIFSWREFVFDGALVTYGIDRIDMYRRAPPYIDRILKGAKPDLPVQQPTKFELAVSLKTARRSALPCRRRCSRARMR